MVTPKLPISTLQDLIVYAKTNPGQVTYASQGAGSTAHLTAAYLAQVAKLDLRHIPYRGAAPAMTDVLAGHVTMTVDRLSSALGVIRGGSVRALALASRKRSAALPDVQSMPEAGFSDFESSSWYGATVPGQTPDPVVRILAEAITRVLHQPDVMLTLVEKGADVIGSTPTELAAYADQFVELVLIHLPVGADGHAHGMNEQRHLSVLRPLPESKRVLAVDELPVPARVDEQALEAERTEAPFAFDDLGRVERIDGAHAPECDRSRFRCARDQCRDLVVTVFDHVDGGLLRLGGDDLRRERARHHATRDPGSNTLGLLEFELAHFPMADRRQTAIVHHNVLADRRAAHDRSNAERIVALTRRAMGVDVDNVGHVHSNRSAGE